MTTANVQSLADALRDVQRRHRIASQHPDVGAVTCAHDTNGLATYNTVEYTEHLTAGILAVVETHLRAQRDAFLASTNLDPAWVAGWHSATDHLAHHVAST